MVETVENVGTEPWFGWHEEVFPGALGVAWSGATSVTINTLPITFNETISGGNILLDNFSQPVLSGDVLVIEKELITTSNVVAPSTVLFEILEYPTREPGSLALLGTGAVALLRRRSIGGLSKRGAR